MVSLKAIFERYTMFFVLASFFLLGGVIQTFAATIAIDKTWFCIIGETKCCVNGEKSCCTDDGTIYDTVSCSGGTSCGTSGTKEYKYTASGCSYTTSTRTCCSSGSWSNWDTDCPTTKTCPTSSRPSMRTTCVGGYKTRTVTCDTSTGTWKTGSWSDCDCSDSDYEKVVLAGGIGTCCQRKDGTGLRCKTDVEGPSWFLFCNGCCNGPDTAVGSLSACGTCTQSMANQYPSYQCCVKTTSGFTTTYNGYVCQK